MQKGVGKVTVTDVLYCYVVKSLLIKVCFTSGTVLISAMLAPSTAGGALKMSLLQTYIGSRCLLALLLSKDVEQLNTPACA
jgi:hypothetical protein